MRCPKCNFEDTKVIESRLSHEGRSVRRRRCCLKCNYRFTTYEKEEDFVLQVKKKDGRLETYSHDKVMRAIHTACQKRPINIDEIEAIAERLEKTLQDEGERTVSSEKIGDLIMESLRKLDQVAYVRFASVYKDFRDTTEFLHELHILRKEEEAQKKDAP